MRFEYLEREQDIGEFTCPLTRNAAEPPAGN
jgi:hypothetical protein